MENSNIFEENDKEVQNILSEVVTKRSKNTYRIHNVTFIFWLFDTSLYRDTCLDKDFVMELKKAANEDVIYDENEKNKTRKKKRKLGMRKNQRKVCKNWLDSLDNDKSQKCPINLANLNFEIFSRYISTRKTDKGGYLSKITYGGMQSGLSHLYRCCDMEIPEDFSADMTTLMQGMKCTVH